MDTLYLLDTNILVHLIRRDGIEEHIRETYDPLMAVRRPIISVVSDGELRSLTLQFAWGARKAKQALFYLSYFNRMSIDDPAILEAYANIDFYSIGMGRSMGKNDLWIAATANISGATVLTTDGDFDHLDPTYLTRIRIDEG